MKKDAVPSLTAKWWKDNQPAALKTAKELGDALRDYETERGKFDRGPSAAGFDLCDDGLDRVEKAADKVRQEAEKAQKSGDKAAAEDMRLTAEALKKYPKVISTERAALEKLAPEDDTVLGDPAKYQPYLAKQLRLAKQEPRNFAGGITAKPDECRYVMHRVRPGDAMARELKAKRHLRKVAWGIAAAHETKPDTLVLNLECDPVPGLKLRSQLFLRFFKPLPFAKIELRREGVEIEDLPDDEADVPGDAATAPAEPAAVDAVEKGRLQDALMKLGTLVASVIKARPDMRERLVGLLGQARTALDSDLSAATQLATELGLALREARGNGSGGTEAGFAAALDGALDQIRLTLAQVDLRLEKLRAALLATRVPQLVTIAKQDIDRVLGPFEFALATAAEPLTEGPPTAQAVGQMRKVIGDFRDHLAKDGRVAACDDNPFAVPVAIRSTLGAALTQLEHALAQSGVA